jgi:hypothetical protein
MALHRDRRRCRLTLILTRTRLPVQLALLDRSGPAQVPRRSPSLLRQCSMATGRAPVRMAGEAGSPTLTLLRNRPTLTLRSASPFVGSLPLASDSPARNLNSE